MSRSSRKGGAVHKGSAALPQDKMKQALVYRAISMTTCRAVCP